MQDFLLNQITDEIRPQRTTLTGWDLKMARKAAGLSRDELAASVEVHHTAIGRWERQGRYINIPKRVADKIKTVLQNRQPERKETKMLRRPETKIRELFDLVIKDYRDNNQRSTPTLLFHIDRHLEPFFGELVAQRLKIHTVEQYKTNRRKEGAAPASINSELAVLRRAYNLGMEQGRVKIKPKITLYRLNNARKGFFEHDQYQKQLDAFKQLGTLYMINATRFGYLSGWRQGEIFGLRWNENYEQDGQIIRLRTSKNNKGRVLPLLDGQRKPTELWQIVEEQKQRRVAECPFIFHYEGRRLNKSTFHKHWLAACKVSGIDRIFHDLRRTAVRNLIRAGVPHSVAKKITGHETDAVFDRYDIVDEQDLSDAMTKVGRYLGQKKAPAAKPTPTHVAACHICGQEKAVRWAQRGVTNPEQVRVCESCQPSIRRDKHAPAITAATRNDGPPHNVASPPAVTERAVSSAPSSLPIRTVEPDELFSLMADLGLG